MIQIGVNAVFVQKGLLDSANINTLDAVIGFFECYDFCLEVVTL